MSTTLSKLKKLLSIEQKQSTGKISKITEQSIYISSNQGLIEFIVPNAFSSYSINDTVKYSGTSLLGKIKSQDNLTRYSV